MTLSHRDAAELERALGYGAQSKSTLGPITDRLMLYAIPHKRSTEPLTARITHESREMAKSEPDLEIQSLIGRVSRKLKRVTEQDAVAAAALIALYGDDGAVAARTKWGRDAAALPLTESGKRWAEKSRVKARGAKLKLTDAQRLQTELSLQDVQPLPQRAACLERALREARDLRERAEALYTAAGSQRELKR